jgi:hypothetical protein
MWTTNQSNEDWQPKKQPILTVILADSIKPPNKLILKRSGLYNTGVVDTIISGSCIIYFLSIT